MSSPTRLSKSPVGVREGNRVILREITASMHNSPPTAPPAKKTGSEAKLPEHEVKVKFAREFIDAPVPPAPPQSAETNSISSASSFQSLTSTLSTKSSSTNVSSPVKSPDASYGNLEVPGLDDLISACAKIRLDDQSLAEASFTSASDEPIDVPGNLTQTLSADLDGTRVISRPSSPVLDATQIISDSVTLTKGEQQLQNVTITVSNEKQTSPDYLTATDSFLQTLNLSVNNTEAKDLNTPKVDIQETAILEPTQTSEFKEPFLPKDVQNRRSASPQPPTNASPIEPPPSASRQIFTSSDSSTHCISTITEPTFIEEQKQLNESEEKSEKKSEDKSEDIPVFVPEEPTFRDEPDVVRAPLANDGDVSKDSFLEKEANEFDKPEQVNKEDEKRDNREETSESEELDRTITLQDIDVELCDVPEAEQFEDFRPSTQNNRESKPNNLNLKSLDEYQHFLPKRQSTSLHELPKEPDFNEDGAHCDTPYTDHHFFDANDKTPVNAGDFEKLRFEAETIANDIINESLKLSEDNENPTTTNSNELLFRDPSSLDFFETHTIAKSTIERLRESLFVKFDPLVANTSMLPQSNAASPPTNDERNGDNDTSLPNNTATTPKRNPAIAAIDRLLFYSPMPTSTIQKNEEPEKIEPVEKPTPEPTPVIDSAMAKELELVRSTVLQLEERLEKETQEKRELEKQLQSFQERNSQLQKQLALEIKNKNEITVVVDEYEKSISRLIAERERDRKTLDAEKAALMEELQETKDHLVASEAAFNDVHAKYERLKVVITASRNNEAALKESLAENVETIKGLENRYEQIKMHAAARLEKANQDLDTIRKQHESEMVKLRAMLKKEELKSNSLAESLEQKTKENKELTQILDEVIARVGTKTDG